jgi:hypothetical protein
MAAPAQTSRGRPLQLGRSFVSPGFDLMLIGGGLTYPLILWLWWNGASAAALIGVSLPILMLLVNQAHFAASTVRLYTKPGAFEELPFLTMVFPILTLAVLSVFVLFADQIGRHLWALYASWSPYHYAAQTFGLASMYCYRSGCPLDPRERLFLRWTCLMPFLASFLGAAPTGIGLGWFVPSAAIAGNPIALAAYDAGLVITRSLTFVMPAALFGWLGWRSRRASAASRSGMPLVSLAMIVSNGIWWVIFNYIDAFIWATVFHGLQYLAILAVFHVRDQQARPDNQHGPTYHVLWLYGLCVGLGYLLFQCWPRAYIALGYGKVESIFMVVAIINVHHFIVDGFIWHIRKDRRLARVVDSRETAPG